MLLLAVLVAQIVRSQQLCFGEFTPCADGSCVMDVSVQCGQCDKGYYLCPPSSARSAAATCAPSAESYSKVCRIVGSSTHLDPSLGVEARLDYIVSHTTLAEKIAQLQNTAPALLNLHIPSYQWLNDDQHGVARTSARATVFPNGCGLGTTDHELYLHHALH